MYTNGIDISTVLPALKQRLGWRQQLNAGPVPDLTNSKSLSGRYFQDFHALVTLQNIKATMEETVSNTDFNTYLSQLQDSAIMRCLSEVFRANNIIEQKLLYTRFGLMDVKVPNTGMFCGWMINIANDFGKSVQINECSLYFDGDVSFNLYLFQDGIKSPLKTIPVSCHAYQRDVVTFDLTQVDPNTVRDDHVYLTYKTGRRFYFGYFQNDLGNVHAIQEQVDYMATPLIFDAIAFAAPSISSNDFDHNKRAYTALPRGLNLEIISFRDHTQQILRKANFFDEAIGLSMAILVLEQILSSTRGNLKERITKEFFDRTYMDVNQAYPTDEIPVMTGLKGRLEKEYKALINTFFPKNLYDSISLDNCNAGMDAYETAWKQAMTNQQLNPPFQ